MSTEIDPFEGVPESSSTWRKVVAWCPLCWWKYGPEEFHAAANESGVRRRMIQQHRKDKPACHEKIRIEGQ